MRPIISHRFWTRSIMVLAILFGGTWVPLAQVGIGFNLILGSFSAPSPGLFSGPFVLPINVRGSSFGRLEQTVAAPRSQCALVADGLPCSDVFGLRGSCRAGICSAFTGNVRGPIFTATAPGIFARLNGPCGLKSPGDLCQNGAGSPGVCVDVTPGTEDDSLVCVALPRIEKLGSPDNPPKDVRQGPGVPGCMGNPDRSDSDGDGILDACDFLVAEALHTIDPATLLTDRAVFRSPVGLTQDDAVTGNLNRLASPALLPVDGYAADGTTQILLRARPPRPGQVTFSLSSPGGGSAGTLRRVGSNVDVGNSLTVTAQRVGGQLLACNRSGLQPACGRSEGGGSPPSRA